MTSIEHGRLGILLSLLLYVNLTFGQSEFSLYRLNKAVPQSNMLNPAFAPNFNLVIGLPVISSAYVRADLDGISFDDVFNGSGTESLTLDTARISSRMKEVNRVRLNQSLQLFYLGMTLGKNYVSIGLHQVSDLKVNYPGDLVGWAIHGPGHPQYVRRPLDFGSLYSKALAYSKTSISLGRSFGNRLRLGVRFNHLRGLAMVETAKISGQLIVGIDSVTVQTGPIQVNTSGVDFFNSGDRNVDDYINYFFKNQNKGTAWDFGATYQITKRLSVSAAVNDIGIIRWKDYNRSYHHRPVTYTYRGVEYTDYLGTSPEINVDDEVDSLRGLFKPTESTGKKYSTPLTGKVYSGISYRVGAMGNLSALMYIPLLSDKQNTAFSLGYTQQVWRNLSASLGITLQQRRIDNIGAGLAIRISNFQVFATTDRVQSIVYPARATRADLHTGLNLVFGPIEEEPLSEDESGRRKTWTGERYEKKNGKTASAKIKARSVGKDKRSEAGGVVNRRPSRPIVQQKTSAKQQPATKLPKQRNQTVKHGAYRDDRSHIVVVGTFVSQAKADQFSRELRQRGFANKLGYDSERSLYRVYVFRSRERSEARHMRKTFRKNSEFQLRRVSVLSVADSKFD
jgi:hypothetical protein